MSYYIKHEINQSYNCENCGKRNIVEKEWRRPFAYTFLNSCDCGTIKTLVASQIWEIKNSDKAIANATNNK